MCIFAVFCLGPYDIWPTRIVHTTKDLRYLLHIYYGINTVMHMPVPIPVLLAHTAIKDLDLKLVDIDLLLLDLIQVCFRLPLSRHRDKCS